MKILLLAGGTSPERAVSWVTGRAVKTTLEDLGHEVTLLDPRPDLPMQLWQAKQSGYEFVWNGLHGGPGEDGRIQAMLDCWTILGCLTKGMAWRPAPWAWTKP